MLKILFSLTNPFQCVSVSVRTLPENIETQYTVHEYNNFSHALLSSWAKSIVSRTLLLDFCLPSHLPQLSTQPQFLPHVLPGVDVHHLLTVLCRMRLQLGGHDREPGDV